MSQIQEKLNGILAARAARCQTVDSAIALWQERCSKLAAVITSVGAAERKNPEIAGSTQRLRDALEVARKVIVDYGVARSRFARNTLCIGVGGAARMGKSTFLQSVTGLGETQIPTSDEFFTTAVRSQIENSSNESIAIADFHSRDSFLQSVIEPICRTLDIPAPLSMDEFRNWKFSLPTDADQTKLDILQRLKDAQTALGTYEHLLTGERDKRISLNELRPYVAYPEGGRLTAGPFLAIDNLVIKSNFPSTDVAQLKLIDLPGLGEAGRDLAEVQTSGMRDVCDIALLMKRPTPTNLGWTGLDTGALDAMRRAVSFLDDQTKYTMILANVGGETPERTEKCIENIKNKLSPRQFEIIQCDARDRVSVAERTMPQILEFLATNLPEIDGAILNRLSRDAEIAFKTITSTVADMRNLVCAKAPSQGSDHDFGKSIRARAADILEQYLGKMKEKIRDNNSDDEWNQEVGRIRDSVKQWVDDGCGFGSREKLKDAIAKEIFAGAGQSRDVVNECRNKFRAEWEELDTHLDGRIAALLGGAVDALKDAMHGFIPDRTDDGLAAVRQQIVFLADRVDARPKFSGDEEKLRDLSNPLRRIAEFDLQFRFHLEPMLHATTRLLRSNDLPQTQTSADAEMFCQKLCEKLKEAADAYANGMRKSGAGSCDVIERKRRLLEKAIPDKVIREDIIAQLEQASNSAQSFCPNRIFLAVMDTFVDAFIRQKNSEDAFVILAQGWRNELSPALEGKDRLLNAAAGALAAFSL